MPSHPRTSDARRGVTLLELLVVVLLLGLASALAAPALLRDRPDSVREPRLRVMAFARATAVRRGETLALDVAPDGRWTLRVADGDSLALSTGALGATAAADARGAMPAPRRLLVTPLGLCLPDDDDASAPASWDAGACRP